MIEELKEVYGPKCSAINVNGELQKINRPSRQMKLCEAVHYSFNVPIQVSSDTIACPGARRNLGFDRDDKRLAYTISMNTGIPLKSVKKSIDSIPVMGEGIDHLNVGVTTVMEEWVPVDLFVFYLAPRQVTEMMCRLARHGIRPHIADNSLLSVCGSVITRSYLERKATISFGCLESRRDGGVEDGEVIVGIPRDMAPYVLDQ